MAAQGKADMGGGDWAGEGAVGEGGGRRGNGEILSDQTPPPPRPPSLAELGSLAVGQEGAWMCSPFLPRGVLLGRAMGVEERGICGGGV